MKERLTGAIILVVLIVLLVPELLSGPKGSAAPGAAATGSPEEPPLRSYTINLDDSHTPTAATGSNGPSMPQPSGPEQPTSPTASPPTAQDTAPQASAASSQASGATSQGVPPPAPPAATAAASKPEPKALPNPEPKALPKPESKGAPKPAQTATAHAAPASAAPSRSAKATSTKQKRPASEDHTDASNQSGWGVQLGVFASHENAERLALEVRVKGFKASVSPVTIGGRKLYRVRVGPAPDRNAAQELQSKLKAAGRPPGTVVPYS